LNIGLNDKTMNVLFLKKKSKEKSELKLSGGHPFKSPFLIE